MPHGNDRALRVAAQLKRELATLLQKEVQDPRLAGAVISDVEVSRDLSVAKVYLLSSGDAAMEGVFAGLKHASGFLRGALAERLRLRIMPHLQFLKDETQQHSERIEQLLAEEKRRK